MDLESVGRHALGQSVMEKGKGEVCVVWVHRGFQGWINERMSELTAGEIRYEERKVCAFPMDGGDTRRGERE